MSAPERHMIRIDRKPQLFSFRVAGLILRDGHALMQRAKGDDFWALPGGRAEIGEDSRETIIREMREELGVQVEILRLLWTVENFFPFGGYQAHELGIYYLLTLPDSFPFAPDKIVHTVLDGAAEVEFRWIEASRQTFESERVFPLILRQYIEDLPQASEHLITRDVE